MNVRNDPEKKPALPLNLALFPVLVYLALMAVVLVFRDITEHKQTMEALRSTNEELERFNRVAVDRESRMIELKKQINELCAQAGLSGRYAIAFERPDAQERL